MKLVRLFAAFLFLGCVGISHAADEGNGICDTTVQREKHTLQYNVDSRHDTVSSFVAKRPCSDATITIKRCAVIAVEEKKIQRFCFGTGKPDYYEYFDVVEYWDKPSGK